MGTFDRTNLFDLPLETTSAHGGEGTIGLHRILTHAEVDGPVNFIDLAVLPPGSSVGQHTHADSEEEYYLILSGEGRMTRDGETFRVTAGSLIRNRPGGTHGLVNDGDGPLQMFVFEVAT